MWKYSLYLSLIFQVLREASTEGVFFHERSHVTLTPESGDVETFGFSLGYQNKLHNIVTGAPHSGRIGKVFNCPLDDVLTNKTIQCKEAIIDVDTLAPYDQEYAPGLKLNLGYSVSATNDYFFTCAPLWTSVLQMFKGIYSNYSVGTCFMYNDTAHRYKSFMETSKDEVVPSKIIGGNGWRTLADEEYLVIAKVAAPPHVTYVKVDDLLASVESLIDSYIDNRGYQASLLRDYRNVGFSLAAGKFFGKQTVYAISGLYRNDVKGTIHFISRRTISSVTKLYLLQSKRVPVMIKDKGSPGTMFGAAMCSADLNSDDKSELLVGAPAWGDRDEGSFEVGAVHIYLGGSKFHSEADVKRRHRIILGNKDGSRFGSTLAANDLDGDSFSEIFISAPYENEGEGALYIISGFEVNQRLMQVDQFKNVSINEFTTMQRIINGQFKAFGHSLQVIPDIDGNGCNELAVGSPNSRNIMILRCIPSVWVTVFANHIGEQLKVQDDTFEISVCVRVKNYRNISFPLPLIFKNEVEGNRVYLQNNQTQIAIEVSGKEMNETTCTNVQVKLDDYEPGDYVFRTKLTMDKNRIINIDDFDTSWALISPHSKLEARTEVSRRCKGSDCDPKFSMQLEWSGGNITNISYYLGSSELITANLVITNEGNSSWDACALLTVVGATVSQIGCVEESEEYKCLLPKGLKRFATYPINIKLNMSQPNSMDEEIEINVRLYDFCEKPKHTEQTFGPLKLNLNFKDIVVSGSSMNHTISDTIIQDQKSGDFKVAHEYWVENKGKILWTKVYAMIEISEKPFINAYRVNEDGEILYNTTEFSKEFYITLPPGSKEKIIATVDIKKDLIMANLEDNKLTVQSMFSLIFNSTSETLKKSLSSTIQFQQEKHFGQNKSMIIVVAVLVALVVQAVLMFVLYKMKFFTSPDKTKLVELQRRMSVVTQQRSMSVSHSILDGHRPLSTNNEMIEETEEE